MMLNKAPLKITLLDLNHMTRGVHTNTAPLGLGLIATYLRKTIDASLDIKLFKDSAKVFDLLPTLSPDIVGIAQYAWNSELNLFVARCIKEIYPSCLIVAGGPNLDIFDSMREVFLRQEKDVDICIPLDGEIPFSNIVKRLLDGASPIKLKKDPVPGSYALDPDTRVFRKSMEQIPRIDSLDFFGSLYADGVFDELLDDGFHPFIQTHRGCPFSCTFCHTGNSYYSKMLFLSAEIFRRDMEYLGKRYSNQHDVTLYIANTNMGLFAEDFKIACIIRETQEKYNWPHTISTNSGKDTRKLLEMLDIIDFEPAIALQTLTTKVLSNIRRINVPFDKFVAFQNAVSQRTGVPSTTELILSLPDESKESFSSTLREVMNSGIDNICIYTLMSLKGTPLSAEESKIKYGQVIRHRVVPRQFSKINGMIILDAEEVVVATNTMSFEDYLDLRGLSFAITVFFSSEELIPLKKFLREMNCDLAQWIFNIHNAIQKVSDLYTLYSSFLKETQDELFESKEELESFYAKPENYHALCEGRLGDNLLRKYKCIMLSGNYSQSINLALNEAKQLLNRSEDMNAKLDDIHTYMKTRNIKHCYFSEPIIEEIILKYDIESWLRAEGDKKTLDNYRGRFHYTVTVLEESRKRFANIIEKNRDIELSLQMLYRDSLIKDFWPQWVKSEDSFIKNSVA